MLHRIAAAGGVAALLALGACRSSGGGSAPDTSGLAGLWDAGTSLEDGPTDDFEACVELPSGGARSAVSVDVYSNTTRGASPPYP